MFIYKKLSPTWTANVSLGQGTGQAAASATGSGSNGMARFLKNLRCNPRRNSMLT